ncbi:MAG: hypothetical protein K2Y39_06090 [Candidatus Obscuribacterales bacterium]|nr:hypothetical protein [Candidatus Obscuribacterales bacterium]
MGEIGFVILLIVVVGVPVFFNRKPNNRATFKTAITSYREDASAAIGKQIAAEQLSRVLVRVRGGISGEPHRWASHDVPAQGHGGGHGGGHH